MARLTRKFLAALGIEDEGKQDEIIEAHREAVDALKEERDQYKADAEKLPNVQKELDDMKAEAKNHDEDPYKAQYDDLKKEYDQYKSGVEERETKAKKTAAYKKLLKAAGVSEKRLDAILKVTALDDVELGENGEIKDSDNLQKTIETEWADFIEKKETHGADTHTPPEGAGSGGGRQPSRAALVAAKHNEMLYGVKGEEK